MMKDILIYGAGGFGQEFACIINKINAEKPTWAHLAFVDDGIEKGSFTDYGPIIGGLDDLLAYDHPVDVALAISNPKIASRLIAQINSPFISFPNIICPGTYFSDETQVVWGRGNLIGERCIINHKVTFGNFNILVANNIIGHESEIGDFNMFMPSVDICGNVHIGNKNFFGIKSTVLQGLRIGNQIQAAAGSVISKNTRDLGFYAGNPAVRAWKLEE